MYRLIFFNAVAEIGVHHGAAIRPAEKIGGGATWGPAGCSPPGRTGGGGGPGVWLGSADSFPEFSGFRPESDCVGGRETAELKKLRI
jgi:hypothetical protein